MLKKHMCAHTLEFMVTDKIVKQILLYKFQLSHVRFVSFFIIYNMMELPWHKFQN